MAQFVREALSVKGRGWTRDDLAATVRAQPRFWRQFERNPKAYGEMLRRLILRGEIEERDGVLFATEQTRRASLIYTELFELVRDPD